MKFSRLPTTTFTPVTRWHRLISAALRARLLAAVLISMFLPGAAPLRADPPKPALTKTVFTLDPEIDCPSCEDAINHVLVTAHGVQSAEVDVLNNRVTVRYDPASINARALIGRIKVTGYTATEVK